MAVCSCIASQPHPSTAGPPASTPSYVFRAHHSASRLQVTCKAHGRLPEWFQHWCVWNWKNSRTNARLRRFVIETNHQSHVCCKNFGQVQCSEVGIASCEEYHLVASSLIPTGGCIRQCEVDLDVHLIGHSTIEDTCSFNHVRHGLRSIHEKTQGITCPLFDEKHLPESIYGG